MKEKDIYEAYDSLTPDPETKSRILTNIQSKRLEEKQGYTAYPQTENRRWWRVIPAAVICLIFAGGLLFFGGKLNRNSGEETAINVASQPSESESTAAEGVGNSSFGEMNAQTTGNLDHILNRYSQAIAEGWDADRCAQANISYSAVSGTSGKTLGHALIDLDGDGIRELLITDGERIYDLYAISNMGTRQVFCAYTEEEYRLCEDHVIAMVSFEGEGPWYRFFRYEGGALEQIDFVIYDEEVGQDAVWWLIEQEGESTTRTAITEEEMLDIVNSYVTVALNIDVSISYNATTNQEVSIPESYSQIFQAYIRAYQEGWNADQCHENDVSLLIFSEPSLKKLGYQLLDLDGNGEAELIISNGTWIFGIYALTEEGPRSLTRGSDSNTITLCENGVIFMEHTTEGSDSVDYISYTCSDGTLEQIQWILYDPEVEAVSDWFLVHMEGTCTYLEPVSESEAREILDSYVPVTLELTSVEENP